MNKDKTHIHTPFVPASQSPAELTATSIILGLVLGVILAAANTYLGLYAGMTVSASIPAAVISMGILRGILKRGTILENNIVQTIASSGESLAAGIIFTIPALLLSGLWKDIEFWPTTIICMTGGVLGILFMIPLRKSHIVEDKTLTFPEGVACAEVLKAGEKSGSGFGFLTTGILLGGILKFFSGGITLMKGSVEWAWAAGKTAFFFGSDISPALVGVGYIVGFQVAFVMAMGGTIAWIISIPLLGLFNGVEGDVMDWFWTTWSTKIRYMGVGAMVVGGLWSIVTIRKGIIKGFKEALIGYKHKDEQSQLRTELSMDRKSMGILMILCSLAVFLLYQYLIGNTKVAIIATGSMLLMSFFFVAVASYIVGLVGSSNSPVSGMTICAVLGTGALLKLFGMSGTEAIIATLGVAGVVCCATCSSGDISQDLKTGYILGATPRKQQWGEILGAIVPAFFITPVLMLLHKTYGIGTGAPGSLKAPQATLFASLAQGLFGHGTLPWNFIFIGAVVGIVVIIIDQSLKASKSTFRMPIMAVAVGIYLPLTLSIPIFIGGLIAGLTKTDHSEVSTGVLFSSGLIAGESLMGVIIAALIYFGKDMFPIKVNLHGISELLSVVAMIVIAILMTKAAKKKKA